MEETNKTKIGNRKKYITIFISVVILCLTTGLIIYYWKEISELIGKSDGKILSLLIALITSGTLGTMLTSLTKARDRRSENTINKIIEKALTPLTISQEELAKSIKTLSDVVGSLKVDVDERNKTITTMKSELKQLEDFSLNSDMRIIKVIESNKSKEKAYELEKELLTEELRRAREEK